MKIFSLDISKKLCTEMDSKVDRRNTKIFSRVRVHLFAFARASEKKRASASGSSSPSEKVIDFCNDSLDPVHPGSGRIQPKTKRELEDKKEKEGLVQKKKRVRRAKSKRFNISGKHEEV